MIEYALIGYIISVLIFFGWTLKDATMYSVKIVLSIFALSFAWPFVLIVFYLDKEQ